MYTIKDLADHVGLSSSQVRRRLRALDGLVETRRGTDNRILVDHNGLELLNRLKELRQGGMTTEQAVEEIREELNNDGGEPTEETVKPRQSAENVEAIKAENRRLKEENGFLKNQIGKKDQQLQQLLPAATRGPSLLGRISHRLQQFFMESYINPEKEFPF